TAFTWGGLTEERGHRLAALGVEPEAPPAPAPVTKGAAVGAGAKGPAAGKAGGKASAFDRGLTALTQYRERTGTVTVPRTHVEELPDGDDGTVEVKLGVWISNTKTRRAKLTPEQLDQLAALGLHWH
ncbi:helicase associated domain-containing protein, partial [Kitasatospora purpeofusca]|uniref:helicase associated domain-containing protein n=1 Tax=Kitasatospora purpeofusca TaxID=67352 RepID=UPI0035DFEF4F